MDVDQLIDISLELADKGDGTPEGDALLLAAMMIRAKDAEIVRLRTELAELRAGEASKELALRNVMLLSARHRKEEWATHMLRFCAEAGVVPSPLRNPDAALSAAKGDGV